VTAPDGLTLHVRRYGSRVASALPVVCLPGLAWTAADFHRLAAALAADPGKPRRVLALDYRGHGQSFLWTLADLSAVIIAKVRTIRRPKPVPSSSPKGRRCRTALIALHSKLPAYWRERRCVEEKLARGDTPDPCMAPLPPGGLQNSAGVAAFWLGRPFALTTATCVRFVTPNLRMICRT
jgi:pimeloyl-ACP methyl ester carboxylesterase